MKKNKNLTKKMAVLLMAMALITPTIGSSFAWIGEPQLPKKIMK